MGRQSAQVISFALVYKLVGKRNRNFAHGFLFVGFISTTAFARRPADAKIVVAGNGRYASSADFVHHFVWPDVVAYQITKTINSIGLAGFHIGEHGMQGRKVGVNIGEKRYFHLLIFSVWYVFI